MNSHPNLEIWLENPGISLNPIKIWVEIPIKSHQNPMKTKFFLVFFGTPGGKCLPGHVRDLRRHLRCAWGADFWIGKSAGRPGKKTRKSWENPWKIHGNTPGNHGKIGLKIGPKS